MSVLMIVEEGIMVVLVVVKRGKSVGSWRYWYRDSRRWRRDHGSLAEEII